MPTPNVTVTAPNTQIVGQPLTLECSVTAARGIEVGVDIIWRRGSMVLMTTTNISPTMIDSSLIYTDTYDISQVNTTDDGRAYECTVVINASPVVMASRNVTLDVMGECVSRFLIIISLSPQFLLLQSPYHHYLVLYKELWWVVPKLFSV